MKFLVFTLSILIYSPQIFASQWRLQVDNDIVLGQDGGYTSGLAISWLSEQMQLADTPKAAQWQSYLLFPLSGIKAQWGVSLQQGMWTPKDIAYNMPQPSDRPYAGVLTLSHHLALYQADTAQKSWLSLGVIGPSSGTASLQRHVHKWTGSTPPEGWQYQIEDEFVVQYAYEVDKLIFRSPKQAFGWDWSTFVYADVGNLRSELMTGLTFRYGQQLDFSFGLLSHRAGHLGFVKKSKQSSCWQVYSQLHLGYRFNDLTIDGDLPYSSNVEFESVRLGAKVGAWWQYSNWRLDVTMHLDHRDFQTDEEKWNGYGSLGIAWHY
ncbi:lipid A deacylase LpxR family protein [Motilimonas pumila]|uniref:Lipid A deacylase LpxR family protein n=1 Tax=Motilimonas pumila TaxID=2303987 RepID=A0A418YL39_9GAMM|nr:lipid A deacylase LpxR family protein [Motilimonas pumila]RJG51530.1 lipid A deacylase LpxR family protein [Motilimonas pumila]